MVNDPRSTEASAPVGCGAAYPELIGPESFRATGLDFLKTGVELGLNALLAKAARTFASLYDPSIEATGFHLFAHAKYLGFVPGFLLTNALSV